MQNIITPLQLMLPDHLHMMMTLPANDGNFSLRWNLIKGIFSRQLPTQESISPIQKNRRERGIWQKRFWEHLIRDELDFEYHVNYIHYNPVKHGHVDHPVDCGLIQASIDLFEMGFFLLIGRVKYSLYLYLGNNEMSGEAPDLRLLCILSDG
jgi:putative transposase